MTILLLGNEGYLKITFGDLGNSLVAFLCLGIREH